MNKKQIIERIQAIGLDNDKYWVVAGTAMVLYGIKDETPDIDLGCTSELADILEMKGYESIPLPDGNRRIIIEQDFEIFEDWLYGGINLQDNIPIVTLEGLILMKKELGREKDIFDIELIKKHIITTG